MEPDPKPAQKSPRVAYQKLPGEEGAVLLHLDSGAYHGINETGAEIWSLIDGQRTTVDITVALRDRLEDPPADLEQEVQAFIDELRERRLLDG